MSDRCGEGNKLPVKGLVLLGLGWASVRNGLGDERRVSWDLLRQGTGGGRRHGVLLVSGAENRERELGNVDEEEERGREAENDEFKRDWVLIMSKGSRFHCASLWTPFMSLAWGKKTHKGYIIKSNLQFKEKLQHNGVAEST